VEGYGRESLGEYIQSLDIAYASNCELETQLRWSGNLDILKRWIERDPGNLLEMLKERSRHLLVLWEKPLNP
jgi:four helix bundle protein